MLNAECWRDMEKVANIDYHILFKTSVLHMTSCFICLVQSPNDSVVLYMPVILWL